MVGADGWRLSDEGGHLVAIAGADEAWVVDDVPGTVAEELAACWSQAPPTPGELSAPARLAVEQLRAVGVFGTPNMVSEEPRLALGFAGDTVPAFEEALGRVTGSVDWELVADRAMADVTVVVRTTATLAATAELATPLLEDGTLHVMCDLASARTIALGPFVVPGHGACLGCLAGRVGTRWGDPSPPAAPGATGPFGATSAAALLGNQVALATQGRFPLVDATISLDLDTLETQHSPCLRSAQCEFCADQPSNGRLALPWAP